MDHHGVTCDRRATMPRRPSDPDIQRAVGARLAAARRAAGMTQEALAAALDIEPGTLSRYEQGHAPLTVALLVAAAKAVGVEAARLVEGFGAAPGAARDDEAELRRLWAGLTGPQKEALLRLLREM